MPDFRVWGHRGDGRGTDENTLASCQRALQKGAYGLELDVQLRAGKVILAHPPAAPKDTLANVLAHTDCPLILHLKRYRFSRRHDRALIEALVPMVRGRDVMFASFWPGTIGYLKRHHPQIKRGFGTVWAWYDLLFSRRLGDPEYITARSWILGPWMMKRAAKRGVHITVYTTTNRPQDVEKIRRLGITDVMTDDVEFWIKQNAAR